MAGTNKNGKTTARAGADAAEKSGASARGVRTRRRRATATQHSELGEKLIAGVPARIMRPRLTFIACLVALCLFGLLMVYSASAVESLKELGSSYYYLFRQAIFMVGGVLAILFISGRFLPIPTWSMFRSLAPLGWIVVVVLLVVVLLIGTGGDTWGASRWIPLGFFNLQPAEFAKPAVILVIADLLSSYYDEDALDTATFLLKGAILFGVPAALIFFEPDLGTTFIIFTAVFAMMIIAGISWRLVVGVIAVGVLLLVAAIAVAPYRMNRFFIAFNPWSDPYGDGYQATLAIMAFASGGLTGRGIGNSTMKYHYLPEAHNDYILAIIGEELGFLGLAVFVALFLLLLYAGFKIAMRAPSFHAQMLAAGCTLVLGIQFFVNVMGITGVIPMTGKPLPFVSYGGSAVLTSMILAGIIIRVSLESNVATAATRRRARMSVMGERSATAVEEDAASGYVGRSTADSARARSGSRRARGSESATSEAPARSRRGFDVVEGGRSSSARSPERGQRTRRGEAPSGNARSVGYERVNLHGDGTDRLRRDGVRTRVDYSDIAGTPGPRRSGDGRRDTSRSRGRGRHDR